MATKIVATKHIQGGCTVNKHIDAELPDELAAKGVTQDEFASTVMRLNKIMGRFYLDNFIYIGCAIAGSTFVIIFSVLVDPLLLVLLALAWLPYLYVMIRQETYTQPKRLNDVCTEVGNEIYAAKGLEVVYVRRGMYGRFDFQNVDATGATSIAV